MATWMTHLRIAENLLEDFDLPVETFLVGNIAPDSGVPNEDWSVFTPSKDISHWKCDKDLNRSMKMKINPDAFWTSHLEGEKFEILTEEQSFLLGYYCHLLTDFMWSELIRENRRKNEVLDKELKNNPKFTWEVKKDWYGLDFEYLKKNSSNIMTDTFKNINASDDYLDYFPKGAFTYRIEEIKKYYLTDEARPKRPGLYLSEDELNDFIRLTSESLKERLSFLQKK
ncbi:hypothetical protein EZV73_01780 [Acidaminobacter sp. JC074]|uniref:zinc dependent phospholipase C family protein n=1 Tax=Acidaminobacter sp. JC074 TaxID=2530199 RepID=UPI001F1092CC|nr:zinc dependent phospholipase C family protein [Acidaminobacter sp. JC074]MCH4886275.1 hypothetical protein [Acidaminobacter sp. JC074]